jgi:hypothetical protein
MATEAQADVSCATEGSRPADEGVLGGQEGEEGSLTEHVILFIPR